MWAKVQRGSEEEIIQERGDRHTGDQGETRAGVGRTGSWG